MLELNKITVKEFAEIIKVDNEIVMNLMRECQTCSYTSKPYDNIKAKVQTIKFDDDTKDIIAKYIYCNMFNVHSARTFDSHRGWGITLRGC